MTRLSPFPAYRPLPTQPIDPLTLPALRAAAQRRAEPLALEPEQERSLLQSGLGLLEVIGRTLDKPGAAARGTIHGITDLMQGDPTPEWGGGLLNAIPFSDSLGITQPENRVSGRDLLENVGVLRKNKPGLFNSWADAGGDIAGFATEVVTDPLFWMSGPLGTLTKAGQATKAAAKAGPRYTKAEEFSQAAAQAMQRMQRGAPGVKDIEAPATLIEGLASGERSILGLKAPWASNTALALGDLPGGRTIDKAAGTALKALHYGLGDPITQALSAPMRGLRAGFDISAQGQAKTAEQWLADKSFGTYRRVSGLWNDFAPVAVAREKELMGMFKEIADHNATFGDANAFNKAARYMHEMPYFKDVADVKTYVDSTLGVGQASTPEIQKMSDTLSTKWHEYIEGMRGVKDKVYDELAELGYDGPRLELRELFGSHGRRRSTNITSSLEAREELFTNTPGMTKSRIELSMDPLLTASSVRDVSQVSGFVPTAPGVVDIGSYVQAADRQNLGRVTSIDQQTGIANVYFHNKKTRATATVPIPLAKLTPVTKNGAPVFKPITQAQLSQDLIDRLRNNVNPVTGQPDPIPFLPKDKVADLKKRYIWGARLKPEFDKSLSEALSNAQTPKEVAEITAKYQKVEDEWLKGYSITDNKGITTNYPPKAEQAIDYLDKQPAEMRVNGLFPRQILEDQHDYMRQVLSRVATMREVHSFLAEPGVLNATGATGVPLAKAWKDAGYTDKGLQTLAAEKGVDVQNSFIHEKAASALKAYQQVMMPRNVKKFISMVDPVINMYRFSLTAPFPAFHVRNALSGTWMAMADGSEVTVPGLWKAYNDFDKHIKGKQSFNQDFINMLEQGEILGSTMMKEFGDPRTSGLPTESLWKSMKRSLSGVNRKNLGAKLNPLNMPGMQAAAEAGEEKVENIFSELAGNAFNYVEARNRVGYAKALWDKGYSPSEIINRVRRSQFNYSELTPIEQNVMRRVFPFYCVPIDCEILTHAGWKKYNEISVGETVLGYDVDTNTQRWTTIEDIAVFDYNGQMMHINSQRSGIRFLFTPDHRWPVRCQLNSTTTVNKMVRGYELRTNHAIPYSAPFHDWPEESLFTPREAAIIGWLITDGHMRYKGWCIYQTPKKFLNEIIELVGDDALQISKPHPDTGTVMVPIKAQFINRIKAMGFRGREDAEKIIGHLSREAAEAMWDAMYKADGCTKGIKHNWSFACQDERVFNAAQYLVQILGIGHMHRSAKGGYISKSNTHLKIATADFGTAWYQGKIWCPKTGTGTWIMRRNGRIIITGNTFTKKNLPYELKKIAEQPGGVTSQTIRALTGTEGEGEEGYTPSFLKERLALRGPQQYPSWLGGEKLPGETTFITQTGITPVEEFNKFTAEPGLLGLLNRRNLQKTASNLHPLAVAALRQYSGEDPFSGRPLKYLHSPTDAILNRAGLGLPDEVKPYVDRTLQALPTTRLMQEVGGVLDKRKAWPETIANLLTGVNSATYDVELERARDLSKAQAAIAEKNPLVYEYTRHFVPKDATGPTAERAKAAVDLLGQIEKLKRQAQAKNTEAKKAQQKTPASNSWGAWP